MLDISYGKLHVCAVLQKREHNLFYKQAADSADIIVDDKLEMFIYHHTYGLPFSAGFGNGPIDAIEIDHYVGNADCYFVWLCSTDYMKRPIKWLATMSRKALGDMLAYAKHYSAFAVED